jgi:hypothetical protein
MAGEKSGEISLQVQSMRRTWGVFAALYTINTKQPMASNMAAISISMSRIIAATVPWCIQHRACEPQA